MSRTNFPAKKEPHPNDREDGVANLLTEGQALLDAAEPAMARMFSTGAGAGAEAPEALVKKGGALEKLGKTDEAIACYDRRHERTARLTSEHLHKGRQVHRIARYDESWQCYEQRCGAGKKDTD